MSDPFTTLTAISAIVGAGSSVLGGVAASNQAEAQAAYAKQRANEEQAVSQREAIRRDRNMKMIMSRQLAVAAASGGGASDPTVLELMMDTAQEGDYQKRVALYEGDTAAAALRAQASMARAQGRQAMFGGLVGGVSSLLQGATTWAKYGSTKLPTYQSLYS